MIRTLSASGGAAAPPAPAQTAGASPPASPASASHAHGALKPRSQGQAHAHAAPSAPRARCPAGPAAEPSSASLRPPTAAPTASTSHAATWRRMERLLGATIDPQVANALLEEAGDRDCPVKFDGFGRITRFARSSIHRLPPGLVDRLEAAIIRPLSQTNSQAPRTAARAERGSPRPGAAPPAQPRRRRRRPIG